MILTSAPSMSLLSLPTDFDPIATLRQHLFLVPRPLPILLDSHLTTSSSRLTSTISSPHRRAFPGRPIRAAYLQAYRGAFIVLSSHE